MKDSTTDAEKISQALNWIVSLLNRHHIPYQIVGGLAAKAYGARRPLVDIDMYVPLEQAEGALAEIKLYITWGPAYYLDDWWDLTYLKIDYHGQLIEIGDSSTNPRFYNPRDQRWESQTIDFARSNILRLYDVEVAVMPQDELLAYKAMLDREVDHLDIQQVTQSCG